MAAIPLYAYCCELLAGVRLFKFEALLRQLTRVAARILAGIYEMLREATGTYGSVSMLTSANLCGHVLDRHLDGSEIMERRMTSEDIAASRFEAETCSCQDFALLGKEIAILASQKGETKIEAMCGTRVMQCTFVICAGCL